MSVFRPPVRNEDPPVLPDGSGGLARRLRRWYRPLAAGVNVYLMLDGTVIPNYATDASGAVTGNPPYDPFFGSGETTLAPTIVGSTTIPQPYTPLIQRVFYGGHAEPVNAAEITALTAAGFGSFITAS